MKTIRKFATIKALLERIFLFSLRLKSNYPWCYFAVEWFHKLWIKVGAMFLESCLDDRDIFMVASKWNSDLLISPTRFSVLF